MIYNHQVGSLGQQNQQQEDSKLQGNQLQMATSLIHCASYCIKSPFQSIQRIIQFITNQHSKSMKIYSQTTTNTIQKYMYITIDFNHDLKLNNKDQQFQIQKMLIYCLRLGKTILYVKNNQIKKYKLVYLISADGRFSPLVQRLQLFYSYKQYYSQSSNLVQPNLNLPQTHLPSGQAYSNPRSNQTNIIQNKHNKQTIMKILSTLIQNPERLIQSVRQSKINIFSPNIIPTPKSYFYQLVFDSYNDISVFKNNKKLQLLDRQIKYDLSNNMQFSLHNYIKYSISNKCLDNMNNNNKQQQTNNKIIKNKENTKYKDTNKANNNELFVNNNNNNFINSNTNNNNQDINVIEQNNNNKLRYQQKQRIKIYLNSSFQPIPQYISYNQYLQSYNNKQQIIKLPINFNNLKYIKYIQLYSCINSFYLPQNNGILLYQNNQLINRYQSQFGHLLQQKFYHKQIHKQPKNIFNIVGQIHISNELKLINFNTQIAKCNKYTQFQLSLQKQIQKALKQIQPQLIILNNTKIFNNNNTNNMNNINNNKEILNNKVILQNNKQISLNNNMDLINDKNLITNKTLINNSLINIDKDLLIQNQQLNIKYQLIEQNNLSIHQLPLIQPRLNSNIMNQIIQYKKIANIQHSSQNYFKSSQSQHPTSNKKVKLDNHTHHISPSNQ